MFRRCLLVAALSLTVLSAQNRPVLTAEEQAISDEMRKLRGLNDTDWTTSVGRLARQIQRLPFTPGKTALIGGLSGRVTEGDAGQATLQVVADTLADVLGANPNPRLVETLAAFVHYEGCHTAFASAEYSAALAKLAADDERRRKADFTLKDLTGAEWSLKQLRGKVVVVNFWATWCPPCRREMPDMETLYRRFKDKGLVILAISDEDAAKVQAFVNGKFSFPVLLDPGRKVNEAFGVEGIPKTFVYDRAGKLAAQAMDRRTARQFLAMLKQAGLE